VKEQDKFAHKTSRPSRRDFFSARFTPPEGTQNSGHIASLMVQARPEFMANVTMILNAFPGVEVHGSNDRGRMVVSVEAVSDGHLMETITNIEATDNVIAASLVYHQIED